MARKPVILRTPVTIRVPDHQAAQLRILARSQHQSVNRLLTPVITLPVLPLGRLNAQDESLDAAGWVRKIMEITPFTAMFNGSGQPAMSVPVQWTADGQPIGMHFVARFAEETTLFSLAGQIERARPWIGRTPPHGVLGRMG